MKRSDMVEVIREYLMIKQDGEVGHTLEEAADYILGSLESFGMLPSCQECEVETMNRYIHECYHAWEDEDEEA